MPVQCQLGWPVLPRAGSCESSPGGHGWSTPIDLQGNKPAGDPGKRLATTLLSVPWCILAAVPTLPPSPAHPQPCGTAGSRGRQALPGPPSPPTLPCLYLDNFFTHFIYEDSPPSANTQSFLSLRSGRPVSLFYSYYFSLFPLQGPRLGSLAPRQPGRQRVPAGARLCLATGADGESSRRWDVQPFFLPQPPRGTQVCLRLPRLSPQLGCGPSG